MGRPYRAIALLQTARRVESALSPMKKDPDQNLTDPVENKALYLMFLRPLRYGRNAASFCIERLL